MPVQQFLTHLNLFFPHQNAVNVAGDSYFNQALTATDVRAMLWDTFLLTGISMGEGSCRLPFFIILQKKYIL